LEWLEITVPAPDGDTDRLCELLEVLGVSGLAVEDEKDVSAFLAESGEYWDAVDEEFLRARRGVTRVKFYLSHDEEGAETLRQLREPLRAAGYELSVGSLRDEDWENNWKQYYKPIEVGEKLLILPAWEEGTTEPRIPLRLDPGLIFGTGAHPSTRMCLEALEPLAPSAERALDLGCGSGILAIAALLLGTKSALGCDVDPASPRIAGENAALNGVAERLTVLAGDVTADAPLRETIGREKYDLIFMNIVADVILRLIPDARAWLKPGGTLIVSGVIDGREGEVSAALREAGFSAVPRRLGDWFSFVCVLEGGEAP